MRFKLIAIFLVGIVVAGCSGTSDIAEGDEYTALSGAEVKELISGNTMRGNFRASPLIMAFHEDGTARGRVGFTGSGSGTWSIEEDIYCHQWTRYFGGTERCYRWYKRPDGVFYLDNVDTFRFRGPLLGSIEPGIAAGF